MFETSYTSRHEDTFQNLLFNSRFITLTKYQ